MGHWEGAAKRPVSQETCPGRVYDITIPRGKGKSLMYTVTRVFTRFTLAALCALAFALAAAASASAISVDLRIEAPGLTIFNGPVETGPRDVPTLGGNCDGAASTVSIDKPTAATAVADAMSSSGGLGLAAYATGYAGTYVCRIGDLAEAYPNGSWLLKINNLDSPPPNGYVTAGDEVHQGDKLLVYYSAGNPTASLDLRLPATAKPGEPVNGVVDSWTNFSGDVVSPAAGANVAVLGGDVSATTAADGSFSLTFAQSGRQLVVATKDGAVRGSAWITVDPTAAPAPAIVPVKVNRFARCGKLYGKGSPKHRRCIKVARAKQRAECRKRANRGKSHCRKLARRAH